jgi:hypothetical protein
MQNFEQANKFIDEIAEGKNTTPPAFDAMGKEVEKIK